MPKLSHKAKIYFSIIPEVLVNAIKQEKGMNDIQMIKEEINLTFFVDDMILCVENLKESIKKKSLGANKQSCVWHFVTPQTIAHQASLSWDSPGKNIGLLFPSPGNLPDPGIASGSATLETDSLPSVPPGKTLNSSQILTQNGSQI